MTGYRYQVAWSAEDQVYLAKAAEWDGLHAHGDTFEEALSHIRTVVEFAAEDKRKNGEPVPVPLDEHAASYLFAEIQAEAKRRLERLIRVSEGAARALTPLFSDELCQTQFTVKLTEVALWAKTGIDAWRDNLLREEGIEP